MNPLRIRGEVLLAALFFCSLSACGMVGGDGEPAKPGPKELQSGVEGATPSETATAAAALEAPDGYSWQVLPTCFVLQPDGWDAKVITDQTVDGVRLYQWAASPEEFTDEKPFETGFSVNIHFGGGSAVRSAESLAEKVLQPWKERFGEDLAGAEDVSIDRVEGYTTYRFRFQETSAEPPLTVARYIVVDVSDGSVTDLSFESPQESWQENWEKFGSTVMKNIGL